MVAKVIFCYEQYDQITQAFDLYREIGNFSLGFFGGSSKFMVALVLRHTLYHVFYVSGTSHFLNKIINLRTQFGLFFL